MRVRILVSLAGANYSHMEGDEVDLVPSEADAFVSRGWAERIVTEIPAVETHAMQTTQSPNAAPQETTTPPAAAAAPQTTSNPPPVTQTRAPRPPRRQ